MPREMDQKYPGPQIILNALKAEIENYVRHCLYHYFPPNYYFFSVIYS